MKKLYILMLAAVAVVSNLLAYDFEVGGLYYRYDYNNYNQVYLTYDDQNNNGYSGNLSIPSNVTYNGSGYDVVGISSEAFSNSWGISSIYIPSSIRYIGNEDNNPFGDLYYNTPITVSPDNPVLMDYNGGVYSKDMKTLYWMYYSDYSSDAEYSLPSSVEVIKSRSMHGQVNKLVLPVGVKKIENYAFNDFYIKSISYQGTLEQYLQIAFSESALSNSNIHSLYIQDELLKDVVIPASITSIPANIFNNIDSVRSVVIPTSVVSIGSNAFNNTAYYKDENNWEDGALYIGDCLIKVKSDVTELVVKEGTRLIADNACSSNSNLLSVVLPSSLQIIGNRAFNYCRNLTSANFPDGLTFLGNNAFDQTGINLYDDSRYDENGVLYIGKILVKAKNTISGDYQIKEGTSSIKEYAFNGCRKLTSVTIPNGVTHIGNSAFYDCDNLTSVILPASVSSIGSRAFSDCYVLSTVVWNVKKHADLSGDSYSWPFYSSPIKSFIFGDDVEYIPANVCRNMGIQSLIIPDKVTAIGDGAFQYCHSLTEVTIGKSVKTIGTGVFDECKIKKVIWNAKRADDFEAIYDNNYGRYYNNLFYSTSSEYNPITSFEFGNEVERIPANLCCGLQNLSTVTIPSSVTSIGSQAFYDCSQLKSIHITDLAAWCAADFEDSPFSGTYYAGNTSLYLNDELVTDLIIPNGITSIGKYAFENCKSLTSVTIPSSVTNIGNQAFSRGSSWSSGDDLVVYFDGNTPPTVSSPFDGHTFIIVNDTTPYKAAWSGYKSQIYPRSLAVQKLDVTANASLSSIHKKIGDANLDKVIDLTISGTINSYDLMIMRNKMINLRILDLTNASIEANSYEYYTGFHSEDNILRDHAFKNLLSLKLPKTLTLAETVVSECSNLRYLEINGGAVKGNMVPSSYQNLSVVLNEGVTSISGFSEKSGLKSITLPASLGSIASSAFYSCTGLHSVTIAEGITSIGDGAFRGCSQLQSITLPESLTTIGNKAFQGTPLKEIFIPANVTSIGNEAFAPSTTSSSSYYGGHSYTSIKKLQFAQDSKLQSIGSYAFNGCQEDSIVFPDSLQSIGQYAFVDCNNLSYIYFSDKSKLKSISSQAFYSCGAITSLHLPAGLESIDASAFAINSYECYGSLRLVIPEKVTKIGNSAFSGRRTLMQVAFPNSLKTIGNYAFANCSGLETLSFPTSLQTIGERAFASCDGLLELRVPSTLLSVGDYAFYNCGSIKKVYTYTVEPVSINQNTFSCWQNADLYVPATSYYTYYYNTQWSQFLSLKEFDEEYSYFYINNDYELGENGTIDGNPDADLNPGSGLIVSGDETQHVGTITVSSDENGAASIIACDNLDADLLTINLVTQKGRWSYFCFPFDILLEQLSFAHKYVLREYDGAQRAEYGAGGWVNMVGNMLQKGLGYIFQGAKTDTLTITIPNPQFACEDYEQVINAYNATNLTNANWNFIGNPYPSWFDMDVLFEFGYSSPIYIWDGTDYKVYKPGDDEYHFHPYEGFFTQNPGDMSSIIKWARSGRETKSQADNKRGQHNSAPARQQARRTRQAEQKRSLLDLTLGTDDYSHRTRIVFNDAAQMGYELGRDAVVMDGGEGALHIWSLDATDATSRLSINERPYGDARVSLGYDVREDGFYTLAATRMDTPVIIYDNELKQEVDLTEGSYTFYSEAGTNNTRFAIARIKQTEEMVTAIDNAGNDAEQIVNVYTILGVKLASQVRRGDLHLDKGIYVIENVNGERSELVIEK